MHSDFRGCNKTTTMKMALVDHAHLEFELRRLKLANGPAALNFLINAIRTAFANYRQRREETCAAVAPRECESRDIRITRTDAGAPDGRTAAGR